MINPNNRKRLTQYTAFKNQQNFLRGCPDSLTNYSSFKNQSKLWKTEISSCHTSAQTSQWLLIIVRIRLRILTRAHKSLYKAAQAHVFDLTSFFISYFRYILVKTIVWLRTAKFDSHSEWFFLIYYCTFSTFHVLYFYFFAVKLLKFWHVCLQSVWFLLVIPSVSIPL